RAGHHVAEVPDLRALADPRAVVHHGARMRPPRDARGRHETPSGSDPRAIQSGCRARTCRYSSAAKPPPMNPGKTVWLRRRGLATVSRSSGPWLAMWALSHF